VNDAGVMQIFQSQQSTFRYLCDIFLRKGTIFLNVLLQSTFLGQFHDDGNFLIGKIDQVVCGDLIVSQLFESINELPGGGLHILKIGI